MYKREPPNMSRFQRIYGGRPVSGPSGIIGFRPISDTPKNPVKNIFRKK